MTTRCDVCKLIRTLSTVISTMYLTPSVMAGIIRVFIAFIVHPSEGYTQITTPVLLCFYSQPVFVQHPLPIEYNKTYALFQVFLTKNLIFQGKFSSQLFENVLNFANHLFNDLSHCLPGF